jgi:hypothetical protein
MHNLTINIARDFSDTPGGRSARLGPKSGEEFRSILAEALDKNDRVEVVLDGTEGYGSSFLEEVFGGIVRLRRWSADELRRRLQIVAKTPEYQIYQRLAQQYMQDAIGRL